MSGVLQKARKQQAIEAAALLYQAGARRVWLFGSAARGDIRDKRSDLDLAVEGLGDRQIQSLRYNLRTLFRCKVDLVSMERAMPQLREGILKCRIPVPRQASAVEEMQWPALSDAANAPRLESLHESRIQAVIETLHNYRPHSVLDLGCGPGLLLERLSADLPVKRMLGVDISASALNAARRRMGLSSRIDPNARIQLLHGLCTNPDPRFLGYEAVIAVEVIEHLDPPRLDAFGRIVFSYIRPPIVIITTPNFEYNVRWNPVPKLRRKDHRFEWTREQFRQWIDQADSQGRYVHSFKEIGTPIGAAGGPTQMAVCSRLSAQPAAG